MYFNQMPPINQQKTVFEIKFGDSIDSDLVDREAFVEFLVAAHNKVKILDMDVFNKGLKNTIEQSEDEKKHLREFSSE